MKAETMETVSEDEIIFKKLLFRGHEQLNEKGFLLNLIHRDCEKVITDPDSGVHVMVPPIPVASDVKRRGINWEHAPIQPRSQYVPLRRHVAVEFILPEGEKKEIQRGQIPTPAEQALEAIVECVNKEILSSYTQVYNFVGSPGMTPFSNDAGTKILPEIHCLLQKQKCLPGNRYFIGNPCTEQAAKSLGAFRSISWASASQGLQKGQVNFGFGFKFYADHQVPFHKAGGAKGKRVRNRLSEGAEEMEIHQGSGNPVIGDIFTIEGQTQTYVVREIGLPDKENSATERNKKTATLAFAPKLTVAVAENTALDFKDSHRVNLAFHRDAICFVSRLARDPCWNCKTLSHSDLPRDFITYLVQVNRGHELPRYGYILLFGVLVMRPELICRVAG